MIASTRNIRQSLRQSLRLNKYNEARRAKYNVDRKTLSQASIQASIQAPFIHNSLCRCLSSDANTSSTTTTASYVILGAGSAGSVLANRLSTQLKR
jgi:hypothetical protein